MSRRCRWSSASTVAVCLAAVLGVLAACSAIDNRTTHTDDPANVLRPSDTADAGQDRLDAVSGELILTRQRDLLGRGLINVLVRNRSDASLLLNDIELSADFLESGPAAQRTISVRSGRDVAVQVPYGTVVDCDTDQRIAADLTFTVRHDDAAPPRRGRLGLDGTDLLDSIRAEQCVTRRFDQEADTRFDVTEIIDGKVVTNLVIEPVGSSADLAVTAVSGTVLVAVRTPEGWQGAQLFGDAVTIPLTFVVNRCDPHALAEVTKRYGLDLAVSVDGDEPVTVAVDVADLMAELDAVVEQCAAATADD